MNIQQYKRYIKIFEEEIYLIDLNDKIEFFIAGSTKNIYKVSLLNNKFWCDCPDSKSWAKKNNVVCKHVCFILFKVIKLFSADNLGNIGNKTDFFKSLLLIKEEIETIKQYIINKNISKDVIDEELIEKFKKIKNNSNKNIFENSTKTIDKDDECPICCDILLDKDISKLLSCPDCNNYVHKNCMAKWMEYNKTCVYCRSTIWINNGKESKYMNLG